MEFCDACGSMMVAEGETWVCGSCGNEQGRGEDEDYVVTEDQEESDVIESGEESSGLPTTEVTCPKCDNDRAQWYLQQIRSADESETRFLICTDCSHKWREDDH